METHENPKNPVYLSIVRCFHGGRECGYYFLGGNWKVVRLGIFLTELDCSNNRGGICHLRK